MNVVIAIDSFKGSMTSMQAGLSAATGIKRVYKDAHITVRPLADGGRWHCPGSAALLHRSIAALPRPQGYWQNNPDKA